MKLGIFVVALTALLFFSNCAGESPPPELGAGDMREWLAFLSSDDMAGRANGSPELERAADWLAERYAELGLKPLPGQDDYFQEYELVDRQGNRHRVRNVLGWIEGADSALKDEYVLLSAHYDHVGLADEPVEGDRVFNGADDNASGVALVLGVAAALRNEIHGDDGAGPKRSIVAAAWSGEELGLLGSKHYASEPVLPVEDLAVNLNFEMVGHTTNLGKNQVWMTGDAYSDLADILRPVFHENDWELNSDPQPAQMFFFRSDNASFALLKPNREARTSVGVPAHTFSTWGGEDHYHQLNDEHEAIDFDNLAGLARLFAKSALALANRTEAPAWTNNEGNPLRFSRPDGSE